MRDRLVAWLAAGALFALSGCASQGSSGSGSIACTDKVVSAGNGVNVKILFAKNGSVQRFVFEDSNNLENQHQMELALEKQYGPAAVNAPPLNVVSFKKGGSNGLMIPDKAVDSCGRQLSFAQ